MRICRILTGVATVGLVMVLSLVAAPRKNQSAIVSQTRDGKLVYHPDPQGNVVPDFSSCGYAGGDRSIPDAPIKVVVPATPGDETARIQKAINYVASLPLDTNGLRGAVLLLKGRHEVRGSLLLNASGVVVRGQGMGEDGTVLVATGQDRRTLIRILGKDDQKSRRSEGWQVTDSYVPVGAKTFQVKDVGGLKAGDTIRIIRPCTQEWINDLGMTEFGGGLGDWRLTWHEGTRDITWERVIQSVDSNRVTVDVPITTALETKYGGARVELSDWPGRITHVGVENLRCESTYDKTNPKDESHSWMAITMENVANAWVRRVTAKHFASSLVSLFESCKWVTVEDCLSLKPISEEAGYRRLSYFTMGQMTLFLRCHAESGWHDFSAGWCAAGPNAFVLCEARLPLRDSGPIESWSSGVLYDNVQIDGGALSLANRGSSYAGSGWSAANSVLWQCSAAAIRCENPPTAQNWAFGCWGEFHGNGIWRGANNFANPDSLYLAQVQQRLGAGVAAPIMDPAAVDYGRKPLKEAIAAASQPTKHISEYIAAHVAKYPLPTGASGAKSINDVPDTFAPRVTNSEGTKKISILNGWIVCDGKLLIGRGTDVSWWRGNVRPSEISASGPCLTRFAPGRIGRGYTDDLDELAASMKARGVVSIDHHYGLWYDRRRDDHQRARRMDGDAWPPFYEQPFARTGTGAAWDGLSLYDLTKYNPWYWGRLKEFADLCDQRGLVLFNENFFQHNIIETGAHWVDCPWRTANNVNQTGFPEPPTFDGDCIFMAEQFYDVTNPVRAALYRAYIRQCLANFKDNANVIQFTSAEYTGPLPFVQMWLDTAGEWERETGRNALIALSCTKDVQDAVLADPKRSAVVDVIDFKYWSENSRGLYAPKGGQSQSPRQFQRQLGGGRPSDLDLAKMTAEYREKYSDKAVISDFNGGWAYVCAGGSLPQLPVSTSPGLLAAIPKMKPVSQAAGRYLLAEPGRNYLSYSAGDAPVRVDLTKETGRFISEWIDDRTGGTSPAGETVTGGSVLELKPKSGPGILWVHRE